MTAPLALQEPHAQPVLIPIAPGAAGGNSSSAGDIPEWAMIEINGKLLPPKDDAVGGEDEQQLPVGSVELGAVHFQDKVRSRRDSWLKAEKL